MENEAQRLIREARARAFNRVVEADCAPQPVAACPAYAGAAGGAIRRQPLPTARAPQQQQQPQQQPQSPVHVPVQKLLPMSPYGRPDPQAMSNLERVYQLSQNPVPQVQPTECQPCPPVYDYQQAEESQRASGYQDPSVWQQVQSFDPYASQASAYTQSQADSSYLSQLSEITEPELDVSGRAEDVLGRARHRALLRTGYRKDLPLYPTPARPGTALPSEAQETLDYFEGEEPSLDDILAGAPQLPPPATQASPPLCPRLDRREREEDDDLGLLPSEALDLRDDFPMKTAEKVTTDAFGLPFRHYPLTEKKRKDELERQKRKRLEDEKKKEEMRRMKEMVAIAQQQAELQRAEEALAAAERLGAAAAGVSRRPGRGSGRPASSRPPTATRAAAGPSRAYSTPPGRPATPSTSRAATCPAPKKTPTQRAAEEKAAKAAAALALTKKRTQYQPPRLKSRPPTKPSTTAKAPRGLDTRVPERRKGPDPTRSDMYGYDYGQVEAAPMDWCELPQPRQLFDPNSYPPAGQSQAPPGLMEEVSGIISQARDRLVDTINKYK